MGLPRKYLGHGICDARSKLLNLRRATADADTLTSHALQLLKESRVPPDKIRGVGLQMTRLDPTDGEASGGGGADGGKAGGALQDWLIKPGEEDSDPTAAAVASARGPLHVTGEAAPAPAERDQEDAEPSRPGDCPNGMERAQTGPAEGDAVLRRRPSESRAAPDGACNKRTRGTDGTPPRDAIPPATRHRSDVSLRVSVGGESAAMAGAAGAEAGGGVPFESIDFVRDKMVSKVGNSDDAVVTERGSKLSVGGSHREDDVAGGLLRGEASPAAVRQRVLPGSPEWLSPPSPAHRVTGTPLSGVGGPSMSQVNGRIVEERPVQRAL